ncbi:MAG: hypothetical protein ABIQ16_20570 [Polyangiaceae bacterium]
MIDSLVGRIGLVIMTAACCVMGCGGNATVNPAEGRAPEQHRELGASCELQRVAVNPTPVDSMCTGSEASCAALFVCAQDSDCNQGSNGRCGQPPLGPRQLQCSYDECFSDAACPGNAACDCRTGASDPTANRCLTQGNCRIDSDCGTGSYCSPSQVGGLCFCPSSALCDGSSSCSPGPCECGDACGHGYFCHTKADTCVDDSDCHSGSCNYDTVEQHWSCSQCLSIP